MVEAYGAWGAEAIQVFFLLSGCKDKLIEVKGSDHLVWPSELDYGTGQCWGYLDEIPAITAFDDII